MQGDIYPRIYKENLETRHAVIENANDMYRSFLHQYGIVPNVIFLNKEDASEFSEVIHSSFTSRLELPIKLLGLKILLTELDRSYVALIPTEH